MSDSSILELFAEWSSLERIRSYVLAEQEPKSTAAGIPPAYWPSSGELYVEGLSARYSPVSDKTVLIIQNLISRFI